MGDYANKKQPTSSQYQGNAKIKDSSLANQSRQTKTTCKPKIERLQPFLEKKIKIEQLRDFLAIRCTSVHHRRYQATIFSDFSKNRLLKTFFSIQFCSKESAAHPL